MKAKITIKGRQTLIKIETLIRICNKQKKENRIALIRKSAAKRLTSMGFSGSTSRGVMFNDPCILYALDAASYKKGSASYIYRMNQSFEELL